MSHFERKHRHLAAIERLESRRLMHSGPLFLNEAAIALKGTADLGPWGRLKLVDRLDAQGDHQFDAMGEKLTIKFAHWSMNHPILARQSSFRPSAMQSGPAMWKTSQASLPTTPHIIRSTPSAHSGRSFHRSA